MFFKKRISTKKVCLIKTVELTESGWETKFHTEVDGSYVWNSSYQDSERANSFFEKVLENKGINKRKEVIREERV